MNITSSYQVRIVNCSVNLNDTVRIYQGALSYLIGIAVYAALVFSGPKAPITARIEAWWTSFTRKTVPRTHISPSSSRDGIYRFLVPARYKKYQFWRAVIMMPNYILKSAEMDRVADAFSGYIHRHPNLDLVWSEKTGMSS